ncbi:putative SNARE protein [Plasmodium gaboni]|uniref:Putative SNARE protein n=1 Tax=Plasmodium gaboni TaxID=647221 RepID=A0A151LIE7_9APIC|nr:putative SNARE protein [Plasmodium gaboni]KYN98751.1 putative SNARE protein [Plasmodium gaboni]SOV23191.1 SNARE protein, putative [Plasmodium sp. DRC-Itaito]
MNNKYAPILDNELLSSNNENDNFANIKKKNNENDKIQDTSLNNIYGKIVKIRKELEKSYNLFYSYNLIVSNNKEHDHNNPYNNVYARSDIININNNTKNNLTLNKINALTNSFYMNVQTLKNTYSFINTNNVNNKIINNDNIIWERRIETLSNEANSYIKTLDNIYKTNLKQSEMKNNKKSNYTKSNKRHGDDDINYLHKENEILKQVEDHLNIFHVQGMNTLNMLRKQNKFLKNVRKKVIDMYNYVGLSSSLVDTIKKTHKQNLIIVIVGIILSLIFFYVIYSYFRR